MIRNKTKKIIICIMILFLLFLIKSCNCFAIKIVIDPGHGGSDVGATALNVYERDLNLKVAKYLQNYLNEYDDVEVLLTREDNTSQNLNLIERGMFALNNNADLFLSLHFNSSTVSDVNGVEIFVTRCTTFDKYNKNTTELSNKILSNFSKLGIDISRGVKTRLCNDSDDKYKYSDGQSADYYGIIRHAMRGDSLEGYGIPITSGIGIPTILIEHCFLSGTVDIQYYDSEEDLQRLAKADADAIVEYYGITKTDPTKVKSISLVKTNEDVAIGDEIKINATVLPNTAINKKLIYTSDNTDVVTVDENGNIKGKSKGIANITITSDDGAKTAYISVNVIDAGLNIENEQINMIIGKTMQINANVTPNSLTNQKITYVSENEDIATVSANGLITGIASGTTNIKVISDYIKIEKTIIVKVNDAEKYIVEVNEEKRNVSNGIISKIAENTKAKDILQDLTISENLEISVLNYKDEKLVEDDYIGTGSKIILTDTTTKEIITQYNIVVTGDINRDGKISPSDYVLIKNHIMDKSKITGLQLTAADVKKYNNISPADYVLIKNHIMEIKKIVPQ